MNVSQEFEMVKCLGSEARKTGFKTGPDTYYLCDFKQVTHYLSFSVKWDKIIFTDMVHV
jgi:hypothetical protein